MAWLKLDDQIFYNRKVARCDPETKLLYIVGLTYCANQLTDGEIPTDVLPLLAGMAGIDKQNAKQSAGKLLDVCLWVATPEGWQIPDYLEYNPSKEQVDHNRNVRSQSGRAGGQAKAKQNAKQNPSKSLPPSPSPSPIINHDDDDDDDDDGRQQALTDLQVLGLFNRPMLEQFSDLWPELAGRRDWVGKAITIARDNNASSPAYALKVLANAIHTGKAPGYVNGTGGKGKGKQVERMANDYDGLKAAYVPAGLEDIIEH